MQVCLERTPEELEQYLQREAIESQLLPLSEYCYYTQGQNLDQHYQKCQLLLQYHADPNQLCPSGRTALINLSFFPNRLSVSLCQLLLSHGAKINSPSRHGETALFHACRSYNLDGVALCLKLLQEGANPNLCLPLNEAICFQSPYRHLICQHLLDFGANPNLKDDKGDTPLHHTDYQVKNCPGDLQELLLNYGADPTILDHNGEQPLRFSHILEDRRQRHDGLKQLFLEEHEKETSCFHRLDHFLIEHLTDMIYRLP